MKLFCFWFAAITCSAQTPVILISIDTLRADHLSAFGYKKVATPNIDSFANGGTLFTSAETQIPFTLPSHTTLLTSTYPFENGVEENAGAVPARLETLASVLRARGYKTAAFIGSIFLEKQLGLDKGFDTYDSPFDFEAFSKLSGSMLFAGRGRTAYSVRERRDGALVLRAANQWLASHREQPVFIFVHLFDMHQPWRLGSYDAQLVHVDQLIGSFQKVLQKDGWWDRSLVAVVSDHGEGLGEHGESDHGYFVYESTLHVPLIVHWPGPAAKTPAAKMPARMEQPVGLIDVAPSILEFLKIPVPASFRGRSFLNGEARSVYSESVYARDCFGWAALRSLRVGAFKYIEAPKPELYDLAKDPGELRNLARTNVSEATALRAQLVKILAPAPSSAGVGDPQRTREKLESLGYIAPGPQALRAGPGADPKDRLPLLIRYEEALTMLGEGKTDRAIASFRSILIIDPRNLLVRRDLGVALIERKDYRSARAELVRVVAASPEDYVTRYELGLADESLGQLSEARAELQTACRIAPGAAQCRDALDRVNVKAQSARP